VLLLLLLLIMLILTLILMMVLIMILVLMLQEFGRLDVLVSNAAVNPTSGPLLESSPEAIDKVLDINVKAALLLVAAAARHMRRGGRIVLVSSYVAYTCALLRPGGPPSNLAAMAHMHALPPHPPPC
jgi:NAD(P)-dependent dehydrogenase (short-subunit alcohol dehydrogenase family)